MSELDLDARQLSPAVLHPPVSKSDALRALVLADILGRPPPDCGEAPPDDVIAVQRGLPLLGTGERIDCGDGAGPFRVLLGQAALTAGVSRLDGSARLRERPHSAVIAALRESLGPDGLFLEDGWPVVVRGVERSAGRRFEIDARESSQFATSLLLAAARGAQRTGTRWQVALRGLASAGYLELTLRWLRRAGFALQEERTASAPTAVIVGPAGSSAAERQWRIPSDWSSAAYLLIAAWRANGRVAGIGLTDEHHPDQAIVRTLEEAGLALDDGPDGLGVHGSPRRGVTVSATECPDLIPTLSALACALPGPSVFSDLTILRTKESDRVAGACALLDAAGARWTLAADTLRVEPSPGPTPILLTADSRGDHRMAMAAATLAIVLRARLRLQGFACVGKSFPGFFKELSRAGAILWYSNPAELTCPGLE